MIDAIFYGLTGAWNAVIHLLHLILGIAHLDTGSVDGYGVDRSALADKIYGDCASTDGFHKYGPFVCPDDAQDGPGIKVFSDPALGSADPGRGDVLSSGNAFPDSNTDTDPSSHLRDIITSSDLSPKGNN